MSENYISLPRPECWPEVGQIVKMVEGRLGKPATLEEELRRAETLCDVVAELQERYSAERKSVAEKVGKEVAKALLPF